MTSAGAGGHLGLLRQRAAETYARVMPIQAEVLQEPKPGGAADLAKTLVFGELWGRLSLTDRERRLVTLAMLGALGRDRPAGVHIRDGIKCGDVVRGDLEDLAVHIALYAGFPAGTGFESVVEQACESDV